MKTRIFLILIGLTTLLTSSAKADEVYSINVNKLCAKVANIPYASDGFSDEEWKKFEDCKAFIQSYAE